MKLGTNVIEEILCRSGPLTSIDEVVPWSGGAWDRSYPALSSLPRLNEQRRPIRICIATEDVVGPVRNGGIGTTYAALAEVLVEAGYDVTLLYLKGFEVENETIDYWIEHYHSKGITFVPVPNYARHDRFSVGGDRWAHSSYNMLRYLLDHHMDVVHVSEWRAGGYLSLLAKHQGLAFDKTLFVVKASSPWLWNRLYGLQPFERLEDLARVDAERGSIELADLVVGGSAHLLRWMDSQGYRFPADRTYVQPNVVSVPALSGMTRPPAGSRVAIEEFVFFGRLEARKGLLLFIHAIKRLLRQGDRLPPRITFLGKPGALLLEQPGEQVIDVIKAETATWPCKVEILSDLQQSEALEYLQGGGRLAVMPSTIENSSLAVYEALLCGIPFIASDAGGNPELIVPADRNLVLCPPHPVPLAEKLGEVMANGAYVAGCSFDNASNLEEWRAFHENLGSGLLEKLLRPHVKLHDYGTVSICIYHPETADKLRATLSSVKEQTQLPLEVLVALDTEDSGAAAETEAIAAELDLKIATVPAFDLDAGAAFNLLAEKSRGELCLFIWSGTIFHSDALQQFATVAGITNADMATCLHRVRFSSRDGERTYLSAELIGGVAQSFFHSDLTPIPLLVRRKAFRELSGFAPDYRVLGYDHELISNAILSGRRCETVLQELCSVEGWDADRLRRRGYSRSASEFRCSRPHIAATPLALREALFMAKGLQKSLGRRGRLGGSSAVRRTVLPSPRRKKLLSRFMLSSVVLGLAADVPPPEKKLKRRAGAYPTPRTVAPLVRSPSRSHETIHWQAESGKRYSGALLGVHNGTIYGWVKDDDDPARTLEVEAYFGVRHRVRAIKVKGANAGVPSSRSDSAGHTFAVPVWRGPTGFRLDWRCRSVTLRIAGTGITMLQVLVPANPHALEALGFDGYCDIVDNRIRGWVWQPANPENSVDVAAFVDGKFLARATASAFRDDLRAHNIGTGAYGFSMPVPKTLRNGRTHRIDVVVAECGTLLKRGQLLLKGDALRFV